MIKANLGLLSLSLIPCSLRAASAELQTVLTQHYGVRTIEQGKVLLNLPALSENGNSVPLTISVDSPMTEQDYVRAVTIFAEKNPLPHIATYRFTPASGRVQITARIRMFDTQKITVIAELNDKSLWSGSAESIVTLAACVDPYT
jgi:sulfur-oxidizing protein SoxY